MDSAIAFQSQNFIAGNTQFNLQLGGYMPEGAGSFNFSDQIFRGQEANTSSPQNKGGQKTMMKMPVDQNQGQIMSFQEVKVQLEKKINNFLQNKNQRQVPIPKGNSAYSKAKRAEYIERNLDKAVKFYKISIKNNERVDSAIKDLATVLHQQGKTEEACKFLENYRPLYTGDLNKYDNLWNNLKKQIIPSGNCLNRTFVLPNVGAMMTENDIRALFGNDSRIVDISFCHIWKEEEVAALPPLQPGTKLCLISFVSYSAARKTFETVKDFGAQDFYWMNVRGEILSRVVNDSLNTSRSSEDKEYHSPKIAISKTTGQPIRRSSFFLEHSAKMAKMNAPSSQPDNSQYGGGVFHPHLFPLQPTQTQSWTPNNGFYAQQPSNIPKNDRVVKRLSFSNQPVNNPLQNIVAKKRWSACPIPVHTLPLQVKTWNCAVFMDMDDDDQSKSSTSKSGTSSSNSSDNEDDEYNEEEMKELERKKKMKERTMSLRECVVREFGDVRFPCSQDTLSTLDSRSDRGFVPSKNMKYDVLSEIRKKEQLLQKEKDSDRTNFLKNLILQRNEDLSDELQLAKDSRKQGDRRTSWDPSVFRRNNLWEENPEVGKTMRNIF